MAKNFRKRENYLWYKLVFIPLQRYGERWDDYTHMYNGRMPSGVATIRFSRCSDEALEHDADDVRPLVIYKGTSISFAREGRVAGHPTFSCLRFEGRLSRQWRPTDIHTWHVA